MSIEEKQSIAEHGTRCTPDDVENTQIKKSIIFQMQKRHIEL